MADARMTAWRTRAARLLLCGVPAWAREAARGDLDEEHARVAARRGRAIAALWYVREATLLSARYALEWRRDAPGVDMRGERAPVVTRFQHAASDLRLALRQVSLAPGLWIAAMLTLGLAVGFNGAIASLVNGVLFEPLARVEPDRVIRLYARSSEAGASATFSYRDLRVLRDVTALDQVAGVHLATLAMSDGKASHQVLGEIASGSYFDLLGVPTLAGRAIHVADDSRAAPPVALISEHLWRDALGADPSVVGRAVRFNGRPFTVIGIVSRDFGGSFIGAGVDAWLPLESALPMLGPAAEADGSIRPLQLLARLAGGVTMEQAAERLAPLAGTIAEHRGTRATLRLETVPGTLLHGSARRMASAFLGILTALVALVLVVAASNVANLLLARALGRRREMAVRAALGARRLRIAQQLAAEGLVLAAGALLTGVTIAWWIGHTFRSVALLPGFDLRLDLALDGRVFVVTAVIALAAAVLVTLTPALSAGSRDLVPFLREGGASLGSRRLSRLRAALVVAQVAIAVVVCAAAALLGKSGRAASAIDLGFDRDGIFATDIDLDMHGYSAALADVFYRELLARTSAMPNVDGVALASRAPLDVSTPLMRVLRDGEAGMPPTGDGLETSYYVVSPAYFSVLDIPMIAGRAFRDADRLQAPRVALANAFLVEALWPGLPPAQAVGRRVRTAASARSGVSGEFEIIGVARNAKYRTVGEAAQPHLYLPFAQHASGAMSLLVRARARPLPVQDVQATMTALDPSVQGFFTRTLDEHTRVSLLPAVFAARVSTAVALLAALLGAIGLHALVTCIVAERRREFGLRMALGASAGRVAAEVVQHGLRLSLIGCAAGCVLAIVAARSLGSLLYGVSASDPIVFSSVVIATLAIAALSAWLPARRAARVAPTIALRA